MRLARLAFGVALLSVSAVLPWPSPAKAQDDDPLVIDSNLDVKALIENTPVVVEGDSRRLSGMVSALVLPAFQTGVLRSVTPSIQLISENSHPLIEYRLLRFVLADDEVDELVWFLESDPNVLSAGRQYVRRITSYDPYWNAQLNDGLVWAQLPGAWLISRGSAGVGGRHGRSHSPGTTA